MLLHHWSHSSQIDSKQQMFRDVDFPGYVDFPRLRGRAPGVFALEYTRPRQIDSLPF